MIVEDTKENRRNCLCPKCPSYPHDCSKELLYCSIGNSRCNISASGCTATSAQSGSSTSSLPYTSATRKKWDSEKTNLDAQKKSTRRRLILRNRRRIKTIASTGKTIVRPMGSLKEMPCTLSDLHFIPAQVHKSRKILKKKQTQKSSSALSQKSH